MERKRIEWTEEKSNRLYDYIAENPPLESSFFGYQVGEGVVNFLRYFVKDLEKKKVLDYGCGSGHILSHMLKQGIHAYGVDMSSGQIELVNSRFQDNPFFGGGLIFDGQKLPYEDNFFEVITCTEVIEHVLPKHMDLFLNELYRILSENGTILFTTPNNEDFTKNEICCPECNTVFHKHGHVNKYTKSSLRDLLENQGFETVMCETTNFYLFQQEKTTIADLSIRRIVQRIKAGLKREKNTGSYTCEWFQKRINGGYAPNLFYIGTK